MADRTVIIGAGIIGAAIAWNLTRAGRDVLVIEAGLPGQGASGRSFGWINASFYLNDGHYRLRRAAIDAWHRVAEVLPDAPLQFGGALMWDGVPDSLASMARILGALGYPAEMLGAGEVAMRLPPGARAPKVALSLAAEGAVEGPEMVRLFLDDAVRHGARVLTGQAADRLVVEGGRIAGVHVEGGDIPASDVVVAAGTATAALLKGAGIKLAMLRRPGILIRTCAVAPLIDKVLVPPWGEVRQDMAGRIVASTVAGHQGDRSDRIVRPAEELAAAAMMNLGRLLPGIDLVLDRISVALRPMPADGLPVIGPAGPEGLYVAVMHSGMTLAALAGELVAAELTGGQADELAGFRPGRF